MEQTKCCGPAPQRSRGKEAITPHHSMGMDSQVGVKYMGSVLRELVTWQLNHGHIRPQRPHLAYPNLRASEFGVTVTELEKKPMEKYRGQLPGTRPPHD